MAQPLRLNKTKLSQRRPPDAPHTHPELTHSLFLPPPDPSQLIPSRQEKKRQSRTHTPTRGTPLHPPAPSQPQDTQHRHSTQRPRIQPSGAFPIRIRPGGGRLRLPPPVRIPGAPASPPFSRRPGLAFAAGRAARAEMEDLLDSEIGKNDYDWLLTPPGTPRVPALEVAQKIPTSNVLPKRTLTRSSSTTRASRLSVSQTENGHSAVPTRPARSNSVTRPSIQSTLMSSNSRTSVLNTSISSVSSRPTTPSRRSSTIAAPKQPVQASRPVPARSSTPVKPRPSTPSKTRPSTPVKTHQATSNSATTDSAAGRTTSTQSSRPSTPNSRSRIMLNSSSSGSIPAMSRPSPSVGIIPNTSRPGASSNGHPTSLSSGTVPSVSRSSSRSSTPTRQPAVRSSAPAMGRSSSFGRTSSSNSLTTSMSRPAASSARNSAPLSAPSSRPSSPGPRPRAPVRSHDIPSSAPASRPSSPGPRPRAPVRSHDTPSSAPSSRPSSPGPRPRAPVRPLDIPDFPNETPPNLRTKLPERPVSAGRSRPGMASGIRSNSSAEQLAASAPAKKIPVPASGRNKFSDAPSKTPSRSNGHQNRQTERSTVDSQATRTARTGAIAGPDNGFGRTISKNSLDMAMKHMDIRQNLGGIRGASLFPHSIRSSAGKVRPVRMSDPGSGHPTSNGDRHYYADNANGHLFSGGDSCGALSRNEGSANGHLFSGNDGSSTDSPDRGSFGTKETSVSELDIYGSSRYEALLLREDVRNTSWLHGGFDDKPDQSPLFDHRFEPLPEPFSPF